MLPIFVNATSFNDAKGLTNTFIDKFVYPSRYLIESTDLWGLNSNGKPSNTKYGAGGSGVAVLRNKR